MLWSLMRIPGPANCGGKSMRSCLVIISPAGLASGSLDSQALQQRIMSVQFAGEQLT